MVEPLCLAASLAIPNALAWNNFGHMEIAAAAWQGLDPATKERVTDLLKLNPQYQQWVSGVPASARGEVAFERAATWPDYIKHAPGYHNDGEHPNGPEASQNLGYEDKLQHRYWHYIDMPFSTDGTALVQPQEPNAKTQIAEFRKTLTDPKRV
jgi:S1/P1 Nuclease